MAATRALFLLLFTCLATTILVSGFLPNSCTLTGPLDCRYYDLETGPHSNTLNLLFRTKNASINLSDVRIEIPGCHIKEQSIEENDSARRIYDCRFNDSAFIYDDFFHSFIFPCPEDHCHDIYWIRMNMTAFIGETEIVKGDIFIRAEPPADAYQLHRNAAVIKFVDYTVSPILTGLFLLDVVAVIVLGHKVDGKSLQEKLRQRSGESSRTVLVAAILSALVPSAGQLLKGEPGKAVLISGIMLVSPVFINTFQNFYVVVPIFIGAWVWGVVDASRRQKPAPRPQ